MIHIISHPHEYPSHIPIFGPMIFIALSNRAPQNPVISLDVRHPVIPNVPIKIPMVIHLILMKSQNNKFWGEIPHFQTPVAPFEVCARADSQKSHHESSRGRCVTRLRRDGRLVS